MNNPIIDDDTIIAFVVNPASDKDYHFYFGIEGSKERSVDAISQYIVRGFANEQHYPVILWEVLLAVVENMKKDYPNIAAEVRRQNIEHLKKRNKDDNG